MTMRDCSDGAIRDVLPDFVHGTLGANDLARVEAHVLACPDCAAETKLLRELLAAYSVPAVDVARVAAAIPRVAISPATTPRAALHASALRAPGRVGAFRATRWRVAASLAVVVLGGVSLVVLGGTFSRGGADIQMLDSARSGLGDSGSSAAVLLVQGRVVQPVPAGAGEGTGLGFGDGLSDLTEEQLATLLGEIEVLEATPNAEPDVHATTIITSPDGGNNER